MASRERKTGAFKWRTPVAYASGSPAKDMLSTWFAYPDLLWALLALPAALPFLVFGYFRRKQMTARLGNRLLVGKSVLVRPRVRRWKTLCGLTGIGLLALASAGPQWSLDRGTPYRQGRDVVLVLDLSRSMDAEQPSRRELALRAVRDLADTFEEHGGNRVALVVFAARPQLLFPLTHDCDHLRHTIAQIEANDIPKLSVTEPISGTRIGAALKLAVEACDPRRANRPIIVLLSDGDDPAEDDEWLEGVSAANQQHMRIHTVGVGAPLHAETIPVGRDVLRYEGEPVRTKLNESCLREIARRTDGIYLPAHTQTLPLGAFVQHLLDADELHEEEPSADWVPVYQLRYAWFLFPAALVFMLAMFLNEGPRPTRNEPKAAPASKPRFASARAKAAARSIALFVLLNVSAADPPSEGSLLRQGNEAFARQDYEAALKIYEQAESLALDPGLVSFNKAAAHYRLGQHREAIECYRRCLEDDQAPPGRRARAYFDRGNALLQYAPDNAQTLAEAVAEYRACLHRSDLPANLRTDARHNLELAQLLWLKAKEREPKDKKIDPQKEKDPKYPEHNDEKDRSNKDAAYVPVDPSKGDKVQQAAGLKPGEKSKTLKVGKIYVAPDVDQIQPQSPADTLATLERETRRIARERLQQRNRGGPALLTTKDW
jgi:Ca-activated chloride channel family protein